jgi:hypothetical protein
VAQNGFLPSASGAQIVRPNEGHLLQTASRKMAVREKNGEGSLRERISLLRPDLQHLRTRNRFVGKAAKRCGHTFRAAAGLQLFRGNQSSVSSSQNMNGRSRGSSVTGSPQ